MSEPPPLRVVGVVGAGTLGTGIAQLALEHGHDVVLHDIDPAAIERARVLIAGGLARRVAKRGLDDDTAAEAPRQALSRLRSATTLRDVGLQAHLVIEAAPEDLDLKRAVFRALDRAARSSATLASNTSALSIATIAGATLRPERVIGLHFFNPAPVLRLVEVVAAPRSDPARVEAAAAVVASWGKTPIRCRDAPGFIVNRVNRPFTLEALRILAGGGGTIEAIDHAVRADGFPMGPFAYLDLVGLDVNLASTRALFAAFGHARFRPPPSLERLVAEGRLGRKTGRGFYVYDASGGLAGPDPEFAGPPKPEDGSRPLTEAEIVERITLSIVNEAYRAADEGVAEADVIDLALRLGAAHPIGPFERARRIGLAEVAATLDALSEEDDAAFRPSLGLLRAVAATSR